MTTPARFLRAVGRHRANDCSFTLAFNRRDIPAEYFGSIAPNWCLKCGPVWEDLREVCHFKGSYWQPPDYSLRCPSCGREDCGEHEYPEKAVRLVRRYYIHRNPYYREAV